MRVRRSMYAGPAQVRVNPPVEVEVAALERGELVARGHAAEQVDGGDAEVPVVVERAARGRRRRAVRVERKGHARKNEQSKERRQAQGSGQGRGLLGQRC